MDTDQCVASHLPVVNVVQLTVLFALSVVSVGASVRVRWSEVTPVEGCVPGVVPSAVVPLRLVVIALSSVTCGTLYVISGHMEWVRMQTWW